MSTHLESMLEYHDRDYSIWAEEGNSVEKYSDCRLVKLDQTGVSFIDKNKLGKNKITFIPLFKLVKIQQELI